MRPSALRGGQGLTALEQGAIGSQVLEPGGQISKGIKSGWTRTHVRRLAATDAAAIVASVVVAQLPIPITGSRQLW